MAHLLFKVAGLVVLSQALRNNDEVSFVLGDEEHAPDGNGCYQPDAGSLPDMCKGLTLKTCFKDDGDTSCDVPASESQDIHDSFLAGKSSQNEPTHFVIIGGMGAGKSYASRELARKGYVNHVIGSEEVNCVYDDILMASSVFKASTEKNPVPTLLYDNCWSWVSDMYDKIISSAIAKKYNTFTEMSTLAKGSRCTQLQDMLNKGYNVFAVFVHSSAERGRCNVLSREDSEKRFASVDDIGSAYERAGNGDTSKACLAKLRIPAGQSVTWAFCENENLEMDCHEPQTRTGTR